MNEMAVYNFRTGERQVIETRVMDVDQYAGSGHGGGDWRLMANWVEAVARQDASLLSSSLDASVESHVMAFSAERSPIRGTVEPVSI